MQEYEHWTEVTSREELDQSEREYRRLFEQAHDAIIIFEPENEVVLEVNQRACELYGFPRRDFVGMSLRDISANVERGREQVAITLEVGSYHSFQTEQRRADGTPIHLEVNASVVTYKGQQAVLSINRDVTERLRDEEALRWSNQSLRLLNSVWRAIAEGRPPVTVITEALSAARELVPFDVAGVVRLNHERRLGLVVSVVGEQSLCALPGAVITEEIYCHLADPDRERVQCWDRSEPRLAFPCKSPQLESFLLIRLEAEGQIIGDCFVGSRQAVVYDRRHIDLLDDLSGTLAVNLRQAELRTSVDNHRNRLQVLVDSLPVGVLFLDAARTIQLANPMARRHLAALADVGVGDTIETVAGRPFESLLNSHTGRSPQHIATTGSSPRIFDLAVVPLHRDDGPFEYVVVSRDVTEEHETRLQLQQQDRLAAVGQMAAGIAHDLNNLLQAISGIGEILSYRWELPQPVLDGLDDITTQVQAGADLVRQILDFSRRSLSVRRQYDLVPHIGELTQMLRRMLPENVTVSLDVQEESLTVVADQTQIQQVLTNLAVNACDAMPDGGQLTIGLSRVVFSKREKRPVAGMPAGAWACLSVRDTGSGIAPEHEPKVFEPFFTTKEPGSGTGLGLSQVYGLVRQHDGHICYETMVGEGTSFRLFLPLADAEGAQEAEPEEKRATAGQGQLIMVVEDDETVLEITLQMLETMGYSTVAARNGTEAIRLYDEQDRCVDLLLSDVVMPGMGGLELLETLRERDPTLMSVLMSGYPPGKRTRSFLADGMTSWLSKPFTISTLTHAIESTMKAKPASTRSAHTHPHARSTAEGPQPTIETRNPHPVS